MPPRRLRPVPALLVVLVVLVVLGAPRTAAAQRQDDPAPAVPIDSAAGCDGTQVREVRVDTQRPEFRGTLARWRRIARALGLHHTTTREEIVRRFVTLDPDRPCTEFRRAESERILRTQPYLASATVRTRPHDDGGTLVDVQTVDESAAIIGGHLRRGRLAGVSLGNENLFGLGVRLEAEVEQGFAYRDGMGLSFTHHQLFGKPYTLTLEGRRRPVGEEWRAEAGHAFLTDLQRIAWHAGIRGRHDYLGLRRLERDETTLPVRHRRFDVGGVLRFGPPGRLGLLGGIVTGERVRPEAAVIVTDSGFVRPPADGAALAYRPFDATRVNVVAGVRALRFRTARGLDALTAEQDIARGLQVGLIAGRALRALGSSEEDLLLGGDLFLGLGGPWSYVAMRVEGEGR
ncbi:MAG TPA: hypothetical protein VEA99_16560, partial [Gemmatimonadaceae bacterium]|nr:hypothetical protein [Gemmatimonadaceae bacterium]